MNYKKLFASMLSPTHGAQFLLPVNYVYDIALFQLCFFLPHNATMIYTSVYLYVSLIKLSDRIR